MEIDTLDDLDRSLVHALQINGRAPFGAIGAALGVSDHTVARHYRRLRGAQILRVVGLPHRRTIGYVEWFIRLRCLPDGALGVARALARRDDVSWVMLTSAGTEITCLYEARSRNQRDKLLLGTVPRTRQVVEVDALCALHSYFGGPTGWAGRGGALTAEQIEQLAPSPSSDMGVDRDPIALDADDHALLAELRRDGRTPITDLASALGCSPSTVGRRLDRLVASGVVFFDVEIAPEHLGYAVEALPWLTVRPAALEATAQAVAGHPQVALAVATSGASNLLLSVGCRDADDLYDYLANGLGRIPAIQAVHTAPIIRTVKRAGALLETK